MTVTKMLCALWQWTRNFYGQLTAHRIHGPKQQFATDSTLKSTGGYAQTTLRQTSGGWVGLPSRVRSRENRNKREHVKNRGSGNKTPSFNQRLNSKRPTCWKLTILNFGTWNVNVVTLTSFPLQQKDKWNCSATFITTVIRRTHAYEYIELDITEAHSEREGD